MILAVEKLSGLSGLFAADWRPRNGPRAAGQIAL